MKVLLPDGPEPEVPKDVGHRSSQATEIYVHSFDAGKRSAIDKLRLPKAANG